MRAWVCAGVVAALVAGCGGSDDDKPESTQPETSRDYVVIPRTNIALKPPAGFELSAVDPSLTRKSNSSYIRVFQAELPPKTLDELEAEYTAGDRDTRSKWDSVERVKVDGRDALAASGTLSSESGTSPIVEVTFLSGTSIVQLTSVLADDDPVSPDEMLTVLQAAKWSNERGAGELPFIVLPEPGYEELVASDMLVFSLNHELKEDAPHLTFKLDGVGAIPRTDQQKYARERFLGRVRSVTSERPVGIAGFRGWEFTGTGAQNADHRVYMTVLFVRKTVLIAAGGYDTKSYDNQISAFKKMTRSLVLALGPED